MYILEMFICTHIHVFVYINISYISYICINIIIRTPINIKYFSPFLRL